MFELTVDENVLEGLRAYKTAFAFSHFLEARAKLLAPLPGGTLRCGWRRKSPDRPTSAVETQRRSGEVKSATSRKFVFFPSAALSTVG